MKWEVHVHTDDEEAAKNLMEELHGNGFAVSLFKCEVRPKAEMVIQYARHAPKVADGTSR